MPRQRTQTVSTKVTEDDYALTAHLTGDQPVGEWICEVSTRLRPICPGGHRRRLTARTAAWHGAHRAEKRCHARPKVRRLADPAGFLSSTGPLTAVLGHQRATAHRGIGTTENGDDSPC